VAGQSSATGEGLVQLSTMQANAILVQLKDAFGNALTSSGDSVTYSVTGPSTAVKQALMYAGAGAYSTAYTVSAPGSYSITVNVNGVQVPGSPFSATASVGKLPRWETGPILLQGALPLVGTSCDRFKR
jgi:hypothetical protein